MNKKPLHILIIPSWYDIPETPQNGRIFEEHAEMLYRAGYKVGVLHPCFTGGFEERILKGKRDRLYYYDDKGIPTYVAACYSIIPRSRTINYRYIYLKARKLFLQYIKVHGWPDIIHAHTALVGGVVSYYLKREFKIPYVITEHASSLIFEKQNRNDIKYIRKVFANANSCIAVSNFFLNKLIDLYNVHSSKSRVIHNNVNPIFFERNTKNDLSKEFTFINIGGLTKVKNHKLLINAFGFALKANPNIRLRIIGDGDLKEDLKKHIEENDLTEFVKLIGFCTRDEVKKEINNADALVSSSYIETFGINIIEALACGKPVIVTNSGGPRDIVREGDGYLVAEHTPEALSMAMIDLINHYDQFNPDEISARCNSRFSEPVIVNDLLKVYKRKYQVCQRCILDTEDYPEIQFDNKGVCNICHTYDRIAKETIFAEHEGEERLNALIASIKTHGRGKDYDCVLGVSGGVDSTYLAYLAKKWGLKPLVVHVDNGWNSELAVKNIENILHNLGFDLYTHVIDWEAMKDMHYAFLKASVLDVELPFDNTFVAILYKTALKQGLRHILCGYNTVTEGWLPPNFNHFKFDSININDIHKKFGKKKKITFNVIGPIKRFMYINFFHVRVISPLNLIHFNKEEAKKILTAELEWKDYGYKHYENVFTRFYQGYILPNKFKIDKRKAHLSTLVCSGQISREEALEESKKNIYGDENILESDKEFVVKKLDLTNEEFNEIMNMPIKKHIEFKSYLNIYEKIFMIKRLFKRRSKNSKQ